MPATRKLGDAVVVLVLVVVAALVWRAVAGDDGPGEDGAESGVDAPAAGTPQSQSPAPTESPTEAESGTEQRDLAPVATCELPATSERLAETYWGMHLNEPIGESFPEAPIEAVNLTTAVTYWPYVETAPGVYDFSRLDAIVATARAEGARPMVVLGFTPAFHAADPASPTARATMPDLEAWRRWVTTIVQRYGDRLDYQVWPEPNIVSNWEGTPQQMARLTAVAGEIIHAEAPDALVVAPAVAIRLEGQREWMDRFWATEIGGRPVAERVDAVALDPFPLEKGTPEDSLDLICEAREILADRGVDLPVWTNEINYGVPSGGHATDVRDYPTNKQAAYVARTYLLHAALGLDRVYWLGWGAYPGMAISMTSEDGTTPTPAAAAYGTVHDWLAGAARPTCGVADDRLHTCTVDRRDGELQVHWTVKGETTVVAPEGARRVETVTGAGERVDPGEQIEVGQVPVAVLVRD